MNLRDLKLRVRALLAPWRVERELDEELAFHVECEAEKLRAQGLSAGEARARALARFGSVPLAADRCRDARGTAWIETLVRDTAYAFRTFARAPLTALTIIGTVALGLGLITVVFTFYNALFLQSEAARNPEELFIVERPPSPGAGRVWIPFTRPEFEELRGDTRVFADLAGMLDGVSTRIDGRPAIATLVTGNFFTTLGVEPALGRTLTPMDDEPGAGSATVVLSHRGWNRLFDADPAAVGRSVLINGKPYEVAGVMPPAFRGFSSITPDYWSPLGLAGDLPKYRGQEHTIKIPRLVGRLASEVKSETAAAELTVWAAARSEWRTAKGAPATIRLRSIHELSPDVKQSLLRFAPIFFAFGLILMIGCANVANLLLARGVARQREIGVRLSLGASRGRIIRQLMTESLLLALLSAAGAFAISRLILEGVLRLLISTVPGEYGDFTSLIGVPDADWRVFLFLLTGALVSTLVFGLIPALQATRLELVRTMRGEVTRDARPSRARHALIALQVCASALLLICAAVFLRSALSAAEVDPGVRTTDTAVINFSNEPSRAAIVQELTGHHSVRAVAASAPGPTGFIPAATAEAVAERPEHAQRQAVVGYQFVSPGYFDLLEIAILKGRGFTAGERSTDAGVVVVSDKMAGKLWPGLDAVGRVVRLKVDAPVTDPGAPRPTSRGYTVVGVARNVGERGMHLPFLFGVDFASPDIYLPIDAAIAGTSLTLRLHGDPEVARRALLRDLTRVDPAFSSVTTLRTLAGLETYILQLAFWVTMFLGGLALALTVSGLFSVLSYLVEQRSKEIGVRMTLGATTRDVVRLVLAQSLRPVTIGLVAGGGLAAALAALLMSTPAASAIADIINVFDPVAYAGSLLLIITACTLAASVPAFRASRIDPIATLRQD